MPYDFNSRLRKASNRRFKNYGKVRVYMKYLLYVSLIAGLITGGYMLFIQAESLLMVSPLFALKQLEIKGYEKVQPSEIASASGLKFGENIFSISLNNVRKNIMTIPWIKSISIRKSPPHKIEIAVSERNAYCLVLMDHLYYVDSEGVIFKMVSDNNATNYPVITGMTGDGRRFIGEALRPVVNAVSVLQAIDKYSLITAKDISEIHINSNGYSIITMDGLLIRFGDDSIGTEIENLNSIITYFGGEMQMFSSIDLRFSDEGILKYKQLFASTDAVNQIKEVNNFAEKE